VGAASSYAAFFIFPALTPSAWLRSAMMSPALLRPPPAAIDRGDDIAALDAYILQEVIGQVAHMTRVEPTPPPLHHPAKRHLAGRYQ
jgi:hypothetical protein